MDGRPCRPPAAGVGRDAGPHSADRGCFPEGLTVQESSGQYRDAQGTIERERSYELTLFYPASEATRLDPRTEEVRAEYDRRFGQESVARVDRHVTVDF
ncbi:DUF3574 domain-containing protein [Streptomyces sp. BH055]|uniref:DUF3574 domain-containing protein n=1 Tax=unclassified Streptomyces TaxID=2593676 RepID=UPI003BB79BD3